MNNFNPSQRQLINVESRQRYLFLDNKQYLNLSTNDYLGLSDTVLQQEFIDKENIFNKFVLGNPSSRLMTGNSIYYSALESTLADFFCKENALVLGSGYLVNSSLIGALTDKNDLIIADKLVHASMIDGIKLSKCDFERFRHNDTQHLINILKQKRAKYNNVYIMVESIYSMDGDLAPLTELVGIKNEYNCKLYVDEAHAFGVRGLKGQGLAEEMQVSDEIEIIVATLGKATVSQGGFVICSDTIKQRLVNSMRGLIFSTALPDISLRWSKFIIEKLESLNYKREQLKVLSSKCSLLLGTGANKSQIIPYVLGSNEAAVNMQNQLREAGYWVNAIRYPTVAKGSERLRISLSADITNKEIEEFASILSLKVK